LLLGRGHVKVVYGPKENLTRPAINPLFRSAAESYEGRVTGVILTGMLDDGVAGLAEIKRRGGLAVVQDPSTALFPGMPCAALNSVEVDYVVPLEEIAPLIAKLAMTKRVSSKTEEPLERKQSDWTCPECRG